MLSLAMGWLEVVKGKYLFTLYGVEKMRRKKYKRRRKKNTQTLILLLFIGFVIVIIVAAALYQTQPSQPKQEADKFFEVFEPAPVDFYVEENGEVLVLMEFVFKLKAVEGDAHEVTVNPQGVGGAEPMDLGTMRKGENRTVYQRFSWSLHIEREEEGFPIKIPIFSIEAEGDITIYL